MTRREMLNRGVAELRALDMEDAEYTIRFLLEEAFGIQRMDLIMDPGKEVSRESVKRFEEFLERLKNWEPLAYVLGNTEFMGLPFTVSPAVLIPRQDTECLVEWMLEDIAENAEEEIADICTGSGCIAESVLYYRKNLKATAADLSAGALEIARQNAVQLGLNLRMEFLQGDLLTALPEGKKYDRIVSNPPYIDSVAMKELKPNVLQEPHMALHGGEDGLDFYRRIAKQAKEHLKDGGTLYLEIGYDQGVTVPGILKEEGYEEIQVRKDYAGLDRDIRCIWREKHV